MVQQNSLNLTKKIILSSIDRSRRLLVTGTSGTGLTTYFQGLISQDIKKLNPTIVFDIYGDISNRLIASFPGKNFAYVDVGNFNYPIGLNLFEAQIESDKQEIPNTIINLMYDLYDPNQTGIIGPRFEHAVRNAVKTILYEKGTTFIELVRCLTDTSYVKRLIPKITDKIVKNYWTKQIAQTSDFHKSEVLDYIVSKFGAFITDPQMRLILGQPKSTIDFKAMLSKHKLILFDFSKFRLNINSFKIISVIFFQKFLQYIKNYQFQKGSYFNIYIEEASVWPSSVIRELIKEGRHFHLNTAISSSRISEVNTIALNELLRISNLVSFRLFSKDAQVIAPEFYGPVSYKTICQLPQFYIALKYLKNGNLVIVPKPISIKEPKFITHEQNKSNLDQIKTKLHQQYCARREKEIV